MSIAALSSQGFLYARANAVSRNKAASNIVTLPVPAIPSKKEDSLSHFPQQAANTTEQQTSPFQQILPNQIEKKQDVYQKYQQGVSGTLEVERHHPVAKLAISSYKTNENFNKLEEIQQMLGVDLYA